MKRSIAVWLPLFAFLACCPVAFSQGTAQSQGTETQAGAREKNIQEYIELLFDDVRPQNAQILGAVMQLDADQAKKFWPVYDEYQGELTKLNKTRIANIEEYAGNYNQMTESKADELIRNGLDYRKQCAELLAKYYDRVKAVLGPTEAARFVQVEDQLLMLIDLQITAKLPIFGQGS
jgi:hypothetical protein